MTDSVKILCCRISWMPEYRSREELAFANMGYIRDGDGPPAEALNFEKCPDNLFRGYVAAVRKKTVLNINIDRLGASKSADRVSPVIVVFCAQPKQSDGLRIVGFYRNATVLRASENFKLPDQSSIITRVISNDAVLIPESDRHVTIPRVGRTPGGFGQANVWYGLNEEKFSSLREDVLNYVQDPTTLPKSNQGVIEYRQRQLHEKWEWKGKGKVRHFIHEKGFCCEACHYTILYEDQQTWGSGFELHHLQPWSDLPEGEERSLDVDDFAVLCAICHRAIHQSKYVSDVALFRKKVLAKRR